MSDDLPTLEGATSINELITNFNGMQSEWKAIKGPIDDKKAACLKASGLDKTPGSGIIHVLLGLPLSMIADCNMDKEKLLKSIKFIEDAPFIQIEQVERLTGIVTSISEWIMAYVDGILKLPSLAEKLA
jgi:hypothetical protein